MSDSQKRWAVAVLYVLFIYCTLSLVREPVNWLRSHGILTLSLHSLFALCFFIIVALLFYRHGFDWRRLLVLLVLSAVYFLIAKRVPHPEEQIHFLEYGLVGILFFRALRLHTNSIKKAYIGSFLIGVFSGTLDEIIQGILPTRHFDFRDILLNLISVALGLAVYSTIYHGEKESRKNT